MKRKTAKQPAGQRQLRVGEQIRHVLAQAMREGRFHDPALMDANLITVSEVRISPDLKNATAFVWPLGGLGAPQIVNALNGVAAYFQSVIAKQLSLKFTPHIKFAPDTSFAEAEKIDRLLASIHDETQD